MESKTYFYYNWIAFENDVQNLARMIKKLEKSRKGFEGIYGIPRGGLPLAVKLSHELNLPMLLGGVTKNTLVVDDIADTGATLSPYKDREVVIVTLFYRTRSKIEPKIWLHKNDADWIVFPWEKDPNKD